MENKFTNHKTIIWMEEEYNDMKSQDSDMEFILEHLAEYYHDLINGWYSCDEYNQACFDKLKELVGLENAVKIETGTF